MTHDLQDYAEDSAALAVSNYASCGAHERLTNARVCDVGHIAFLAFLDFTLYCCGCH